VTRNEILAVAIVLASGCGAGDSPSTNPMRQSPIVQITGGTSAALAHAGTGVIPTAGVGTIQVPPNQTGAAARPGGGPAGTPGLVNPPPPPPAAAGKAAPPPAGGASAPPTGTAGAAPMLTTTKDPMIPEVKGECPPLETGAINFMGLQGNIEAGPKPASPTAAMLLYWHGTGSTAGEYAFMAGAIAQGVTGSGGVIVSFENTTNKGNCGISGTAIFCTGDFDVMDQYVACAVKNRNVDPHKIYTAGCSAGGLTATDMAAERSQYIAAAAPNSGGFVFPSQFNSMHTPALMAMHGAPGQDVVGIDFSQSSATAEMAFKQRGGLAIDCNTGGGHCGAGGLAGDAWKFFQAHPFGVDPDPYKTMLPAGFSTQCKIQ
jgi:hypothetical protein